MLLYVLIFCCFLLMNILPQYWLTKPTGPNPCGFGDKKASKSEEALCDLNYYNVACSIPGQTSWDYLFWNSVTRIQITGWKLQSNEKTQAIRLVPLPVVNVPPPQLILLLGTLLFLVFLMSVSHLRTFKMTLLYCILFINISFLPFTYI